MADFLHGRGCAQANFSQFLRRENAQMAAFLRRCLEVGDRGRTIEQIRDGKAKPSQKLADHEYFGLSLSVIWTIVQTDLPVLAQQLSSWSNASR